MLLGDAPGLNKGISFEYFHNLGNTELLMDRCVIAGVISSLINFNTWASISSIPADLEFIILVMMFKIKYG